MPRSRRIALARAIEGDNAATELISAYAPPVASVASADMMEAEPMEEDEESPIDVQTTEQSAVMPPRVRGKSFPHNSSNNVNIPKRHKSFAMMDDTERKLEETGEVSPCVTPTFASAEQPKSLKTLELSPLPTSV